MGMPYRSAISRALAASASGREARSLSAISAYSAFLESRSIAVPPGESRPLGIRPRQVAEPGTKAPMPAL